MGWKTEVRFPQKYELFLLCHSVHTMIGVRIPAGAVNFSLRHCVHTGSEAHPASYPMGTGGFFLGSKAAAA
jgi:hypothetical protein